jgi:oligopeptide/dipeptide ABC transporter ATP-binding protein
VALLEVRDLRVAYRHVQGEAVAVDGVSFDLDTGDYLGLVGESGCGKSTIAKAILGILPQSAQVSGSLRFSDRELIGLPPSELRRIRWRDIALIPQNAMNGFDPVYTIEKQLDEAIAAHAELPSRERRQRISVLFAMVGLPEARLKDYAHQFSGGMRQRAMIAMALALDPKLIVADEPTTGLDVIIQDKILGEIADIHARSGNAMLLITHDMAVVSENCDRIAVMYAGRIMEMGGSDVFLSPTHPYTMGLCNAFPDPGRRDGELISIPGVPPSLIDPPGGCRFHPRCPFATPRCIAETPPLAEIAPGHFAACHYADRAAEFRERARDPSTWNPESTAPNTTLSFASHWPGSPR